MGYDVSDYNEVDRLFGSLEDFDALVERAHALGLKVIMDQVLSHTSDQHPWFRESRLSRTNARADWYVWADPKTDGSPPNNWPSVFGGRAWEWNPSRGQYYLHNFLTEQPDLNFHNPDVQDAVLDVMRFWLERGVDGFRLDTVNYYFHDQQLRNNPPAKLPKHLPYAVNPYDMQEHRYGKSQPENVGFLKRVRTLLDEFPGTTTVGEVGDSHIGPRADGRVHLAAATSCTWPTPSTCWARNSPPRISAPRSQRFFDASADGWPCWSFSNHDVDRHVTPLGRRMRSTRRRWRGRPRRMLIALQAARSASIRARNSACREADILFEELTDPPGIRFWPEYKGRDGCRTPMPWDEGEAPNGFTTGKPWLPVKPEHSALNVAAQNADPDSTLQLLSQGARLPPRASGADRRRHRVHQDRRAGARLPPYRWGREPGLHLQSVAARR